MPQNVFWRTESGPMLVAEAGSMQAVVREAGGHARFQMRRLPGAAGAGFPVLLTSGTAASVAAAMAAAELALMDAARPQPPKGPDGPA